MFEDELHPLDLDVPRFAYISAIKQTIKVLEYMKTKIAIKLDSVTPFGGIFYAMDEFFRSDMNLGTSFLLPVVSVCCQVFDAEFII